MKTILFISILLVSTSIFSQKNVFNVNSYWVYKNTSSNVTDTVKVVDAALSIYYFPKSDDHYNVYYNINKSSLLNIEYYFCNLENSNLNYIRTIEDGFGASLIANYVYCTEPVDDTLKKIEFIKKHDTLTIGNIQYSNVIEVLTKYNFIENYSTVKYYWDSNIGILKKVVYSDADSSVWILNDYSISGYTNVPSINNYNNRLMIQNPISNSVLVLDNSVSKIKMYSINGIYIGTIDCNKSNSEYNCDYLTNGLYIFVLIDENENIIQKLKILKSQ